MNLLAVEIVIGLLGAAAFKGGLVSGGAIVHAIWWIFLVSLAVEILYSAVLRARRRE